MTDITEIKSRLASQAESVAQHLLPNGRREGSEWRVGSTDGESGKSLAIHLSGTKSGVWCDFASGEGGDLIDLWGQVRQLSLKDALKEVKDYLGIREPDIEFGGKQNWKKPERPDARAPQSGVLEYLRENRNLSGEAIAAYKIGERIGRDGGDEILFPFIQDGELVLVKYRAALDGAKPAPTEAGCKPILFGWQAIPDDARKITITEGEIDAMSMWDYGYPSLSVPFGGGKGAKQQWIDHEYHNLDRFETIYLAMDSDGPGQEAATEIADRLGRHRCRLVALPRKDANECLIDGVPSAEIDSAMNASSYIEPDELHAADYYMEDVLEMFSPDESVVQTGYCIPWGKLTDRLRFRPGELTIWQGRSGDGKSQILNHACIEFITQGAKVCIASLEMSPKQTLRRMVKQAGGTGQPTQMFVRRVINWLADSLWLFSLVGKTKADRLLEVFEYARRRYGVKVFVIDSLMRLGISPDDYAGQEELIFQIVDWVTHRDAHVHLVAHSRKGDGSGSIMQSEDVKGTSEIINNAFNIIGVWRNRRREEDVEKLGAKVASDQCTDDEREAYNEAVDKPGVVFSVLKQRNGDWEGRLGLWFDKDTYQYTNNPRRITPRNYCPEERDDGPEGNH